MEKFKEVIKLTGISITKLDSSSKAGFAISTSRDFDLPIKFIGVGEKLEDLVPFDPSDFSKALFKWKILIFSNKRVFKKKVQIKDFYNFNLKMNLIMIIKTK